MAQQILPDCTFTRTIAAAADHSGNSIQFWRCQCGWTTAHTTWPAGSDIPDRPTMLQSNQRRNHFHLKPLSPPPQELTAMAKSRDPNSYNPLIRQIFLEALQQGHYRSGELDQKYANSLRFDLNGYKSALKDAGGNDAELLGYASVSLYLQPSGKYIIEVYPGGPAWTDPSSMGAVLQGLSVKQPQPEQNASAGMGQSGMPPPALTLAEQMERLTQELGGTEQSGTEPPIVD